MNVSRLLPLLVVPLLAGCPAPYPKPERPTRPAPTPAPSSPAPVHPTPSPTPVASPAAAPPSPSPVPPPVRREVQPQEVVHDVSFQAQVHRPAPGLPSPDVRAVAALHSSVLAATGGGLARLQPDGWVAVPGLEHTPVSLLAAREADVLALSEEALYAVGEQATRLADTPAELGPPRSLVAGKRILLAGAHTFWALAEGAFARLEAPPLGEGDEIRQIAEGPEGELAAATTGGLYRAPPGGLWKRLEPAAEREAWDPRDVRAVGYDPQGRLWFAAPQGVGVREAPGRWRLYGVEDGLPWNGFTCLQTTADGVWLGTDRGAIRFDGQRWAYRQGRRWLPGDDVRGISLDGDGGVWFATAAGVSGILPRSMTLAAKAAELGAATQARHLRTDYGYVGSVRLARAGQLDPYTQRASDNDGLWTAMWGAAACFAWAAEHDPQARQRAEQAFEALRFLSQVTQGGQHEAQPGFPARSVLPSDGPDPNQVDSRERDRAKRAEKDALWKVIVPRWPRSADGAWYWKCDTSSDELDGHFFFYAQYYDLVADTEEERARVRAVVKAIVDHLIRNGLRLVDHDGQPTRWANYAPQSLNFDPAWFEERGLNSLSVLSYLKVAEHVTGDALYAETARRLVEEHGYAQNLLATKVQQGPGTGNQSDDELACMGFYDLLLYEQDPKLREVYGRAFHDTWELLRAERNPFFNVAYAAVCTGQETSSPWGHEDLTPSGPWLQDAVTALRRLPLDRVRWGLENSHRLDVVCFPARAGQPARGRTRGGEALPIDERWVAHWNADPWALDVEGDGRTLADGTVFLLPYYMARFHGFLVP